MCDLFAIVVTRSAIVADHRFAVDDGRSATVEGYSITVAVNRYATAAVLFAIVVS